MRICGRLAWTRDRGESSREGQQGPRGLTTALWLEAVLLAASHLEMRFTSPCQSGREGLSHRDCECGSGSAAGPQRVRGKDRLCSLPVRLGQGTNWGCSSIPRCPHSFLGVHGPCPGNQSQTNPMCFVPGSVFLAQHWGCGGGRAGQWGGRWSPRSPEDDQAGRGLSISHTSVLGEAIWRWSVMVGAGMMPTGTVAAPCPKQLHLAPKY